MSKSNFEMRVKVEQAVLVDCRRKLEALYKEFPDRRLGIALLAVEDAESALWWREYARQEDARKEREKQTVDLADLVGKAFDAVMDKPAGKLYPKNTPKPGFIPPKGWKC